MECLSEKMWAELLVEGQAKEVSELPTMLPLASEFIWLGLIGTQL